jgi:hypothetical protein
LIGDGDGYESHIDYYTDQSSDPDSLTVKTLNQAGQDYQTRYNLIEEQLDISEKAMNVTLSAYNELYKYYNLHKEYVQVIEDLEGYRDELSEMRKWVERYPNHFHDRTTTACT